MGSARGTSPSARALPGRNLGTLANACGQYDLAARSLDVAVTLMPAVPLRGTSWTDRERPFGEHRGLASQAFAAHCALLDPLRAVQQPPARRRGHHRHGAPSDGGYRRFGSGNSQPMNDPATSPPPPGPGARDREAAGSHAWASSGS